jgi:GT2 family glycosyltransferase
MMTQQHVPEPTEAVPGVAVIIVNWNGCADTLDCLASLAELDYGNLHVIVVDNASSDDSVAAIRASFPDVTVLESLRNLGFAGGNNLGIRKAVTWNVTYVWLLNNDTVVRRDALRLMIEAAEAHPTHTFVGSWIMFAQEPDKLWFGGGRYDWRTGAVGHDGYGERPATIATDEPVITTSWITGCSLLVRVSALGELGLLDEDLFLYGEELDWQLRLNPKRPSALLVQQPLILHKIGMSTGSTESYLGALFMSRNFLKLAFRHGGIAAPIWYMAWLAYYVVIPSLKDRRHAARAALRSLTLLQRPGAEIVSMVTGQREPHESFRHD